MLGPDWSVISGFHGDWKALARLCLRYSVLHTTNARKSAMGRMWNVRAQGDQPINVRRRTLGKGVSKFQENTGTCNMNHPWQDSQFLLPHFENPVQEKLFIADWYLYYRCLSLLLIYHCRLITFPTRRKPDIRQKWLQILNRADPKNRDRLLEPSKDQRVCSAHFVGEFPISLVYFVTGVSSVPWY